MTKGRIVVVKEHGKPFAIEEYELPAPEPGGMTLRITQAGICGSDLHTWRGEMTARQLPPNGQNMGHEGAGVVHQLGDGVDTDSLGRPLQEGDRIIHTAIMPCNRCYNCLRGEQNWCTAGPPRRIAGEYPYFTGTYADYFWVPPDHPVFKVPDELSDDVLGWVNCAMGTVTEGLLRAGCQEGHYVVIQGAGRAGAERHGDGQGHGRPPRDPAGPAARAATARDRVRGRRHDQHRGVRHPRSPAAAGCWS